MRVNIVIVGVLVALAFAGGWYVASSTQKSAKTPAPQATTQTQPTTTNTTPAPTEPLDIYSGTGMTPAALYDTLNSMSGVDFDKRYINYVILMQSNLEGINRLAKDKAVAPAFKARATELWGIDSQRLSDLYTLQKVQGYTHH